MPRLRSKGPRRLTTRATLTSPTLIDPGELVLRGSPPDGIPPIDAPKFAPASEIDWLDDEEPVLSLTVGDEDPRLPTTGDDLARDRQRHRRRRPGGGDLLPAVHSGVALSAPGRGPAARLRHLWSALRRQPGHVRPADRVALAPAHRAGLGRRADRYPAESRPDGHRRVGAVRESHPDALVLTRDTGFARDYGRNPYTGYDDPNGELLVDPPGRRRPRLPVKERVVGITVGEESVAIRRSRVADERVVADSGRPRPRRVASAGPGLGPRHRPGFRRPGEIGSIGVFRPMLDGRQLTLPCAAGVWSMNRPVQRGSWARLPPGISRAAVSRPWCTSTRFGSPGSASVPTPGSWVSSHDFPAIDRATPVCNVGRSSPSDMARQAGRVRS